MSSQVHATAIVHPSAQLGKNVFIGPFCVIGEGVSLGDGCVLRSHVNLEGRTFIGARNTFFPFCSVGAPPQDLKYQGEDTLLEIGDENIIRESATLQPGTIQGGGRTVVGSRNLFMAYSHVAHDCIVGDGNVLANGVQLSGHVNVHNKAVLGGMSAIHQFCSIGDYAMLGGGSMVVKDVPPFAMVAGNHACYKGLNTVGMRRGGMKASELEDVKKVYAKLIHKPSATVEESIQELESSVELSSSQYAQMIFSFFRSTQRGVVRKND